jgi:diaminopimelate decarboxylase
MESMISDDVIADIARLFLTNGTIDIAVDTAVVLYDLDFLERRVGEVRAAFPKNTIHTVAVKANPLKGILAFIEKLGCGFEVASLPELELARTLGAGSRLIVFDSPAKTIDEIRGAIHHGCHINIDSFEELRRIDEIIGNMRGATTATFGIRLNPQVGTGKIETTSVAGKYSKFGIPLTEFADEVTQAYLERPWLTGVHLHIGPQGCPMEMLLRGCGEVYSYVASVNEKLGRKNVGHRIDIFDIGGGLPVRYKRDDQNVTVEDYANKLQRKCPALFSREFSLITEFGRYVHANSAWVMSRVEYVKEAGGGRTAIIHVGADMFLRKCYRPQDWHHETAVLDKIGQLKPGKKMQYNIAGPLCFAGDFVDKEVMLPELESGDHIVIKDVGAYTLSMWSRYNSRQMPMVLGYRRNGEEVATIRQRESVDDVLSFWGT